MTSLFEGGLEAFREAFPACATLLPPGGKTSSTIVWEDGRAIDIDIDARRLYAQSADDFTRGQVERYLASPVRVLANQPTGVGLDSALSVRMATALVSELRGRGLPVAAQPTARCGYLIILGIGLGYHLLPLIEALDVHDVIIAESFAEFCWHSLSCADWRAIVEACRKRKTRLHMVMAKTPDEIANGIGKALADTDAMFLDGTYIFTHYASWIHNEVQGKLYATLNQYYVSRGYYEDEFKMIRNATGNFLRHEFSLITVGRRPRRQEPVFIVGSGPSVDNDIEHIRRWKDHALVFSCGSALQVLLSHGIVPDFQVDLENGSYIADIAQHVGAKYRLDGIRYVGSATVVPEAPAFYRQVHLFFRDSVSSTMTLGGSFGFLRGTAPTCVNSAFAVASAWGFEEIYLFGVDCGSKTKGQHSPHSIYHTMDEFREQEQAAEEFSMPLPGNFGGTVRTDWVFDMSRRMIEALQRRRQCRLFNCSDGARIAGAATKLGRTIKFAHPPLDKAAVVAAATQWDRHFRPGEFFDTVRLAPLVADCDAMIVECRRLMDAAEEEDRDLAALHQRVEAFLASAMERFHGAPRVFSGSALGFIRIASYYLNRIADETERYSMFRYFLGQYRASLDEMTEGTRRLFAEAADAVSSRQ